MYFLITFWYSAFMDIKWKRVENIEEYVKKTLAREASDIPQSEIDASPWVLAEMDVSKIHTDTHMITNHDNDSLHIARKESFEEMIRKGEELLPLIVLGKNLYLVDGYARFRALRDLGISKIQVFKQT
jgi:hypothetical protein